METFKSLFQKYKQLIPVLVLAGFSVWTFISSLPNSAEITTVALTYSLTSENYLAFFLVILNIASFFFFHKLYKYFLLLTLLLGLTTLVNYTPTYGLGSLRWTVGVSIYKGTFGMAFQPVTLIASLITYVINFHRVNRLLFEQFRPYPKDAKVQEEFEKLERKENFKKINNYKSTEELMMILSDDRFVPEAKEAIQELLKERQNKV